MIWEGVTYVLQVYALSHPSFVPPGKQQLRCLQSSLECLLDCSTHIQSHAAHANHTSMDSSSTVDGHGSTNVETAAQPRGESDLRPLLSVLVHRLQSVLKQLVTFTMKRR